MRMMHRTLIAGLLSLACSASGGCKTFPANQAESVLRGGSKTENQDEDATCGNEGMAKRRAAVFDRTKSCAVDAVGIGIADAIQTAALAAGEAKALAFAIKAFNQIQKTKKFSLNVAKATLCAETLLGGYALTVTTRNLTDQLLTYGLTPDAEYTSLTSIAKSAGSAGAVDVFAALGKFINDPTLENAVAFGGGSIGSFGDIRQLLITCTPIFSSVLHLNQLNVVQLANMSSVFGKIGLAGALANCTSAGLFNAIDVGTESNCLIKDLRLIEKQNSKILTGEQALCDGLATIASLPTSRPAIIAVRNTIDPKTGELDAPSAVRASLCQQIISRWGRCLASSPIADRSKSYCTKMCTYRSNAVYDDFNQVARKTGFPDLGEIVGLIDNAAEFCIRPGNPPHLVNDGIKPCVDLCMEGTG